MDLRSLAEEIVATALRQARWHWQQRRGRLTPPGAKMEIPHVFEVLTTRKTVHTYEPGRSLPDGLLERGLETALAAPNHRMTEPWRFFQVGMESRRKLADLAIELKSEGRDSPLPEVVRKKIEGKILHPCELIVVARKPHEDAFTAREDYAALACAIQNLSLFLWSEGVGSKWSTGGVTRHDKTYEILGLSPTELKLEGFVWVGYELAPGKPKLPRKLALEGVLKKVP